MNELPEMNPCIVRIGVPPDPICGMGFLISDRHVMTCAHVVADYFGIDRTETSRLGGEVELDFPLVAPGVRLRGSVVAWHAVRVDPGSGVEDIAVLELQDPPPPAARALTPALVDRVWQHPFRAFGFPTGRNDGVWADGELRDVQTRGWIQIDQTRTKGHAVVPGFSGGPVWDDDPREQAIVGIVVASEENGVAYIIPTRLLIQAWPALGERIQDARPPIDFQEPVPPDVPLYGRTAQLDQLLKLMESLHEGRGAICLVVGESGVGKTTLLQKFQHDVFNSFKSTLVLRTAAELMSGEQSKYGPFRGLLEPILLSGRPTDAGNLMGHTALEIAAETLDRLGIGNLGPLAPFTGEATAALVDALRTRNRKASPEAELAIGDEAGFFDCFARLLRNISRAFPIVLLIDDLDEADQWSLDLFLHLSRLLRDSPVMIVGAFRPESLNEIPAFGVLYSELVSVGAKRIDMALSKEGVLEFCLGYVEGKYGTSFPQPFLTHLASVTGGNGLFLSELLADYQEDGVICFQDGCWTVLREVVDLPVIPERVELTLKQRLLRVDPEMIDVLEGGAVEGSTFAAEVVADVLELEQRDLWKRITDLPVKKHELVLAGANKWVGPRRIHTFQFKHGVFRKYFYGSVDDREDYHYRVGESIKRIWANSLDDRYADLAWHFSQAGDFKQAADYAKDAAASAARHFDFGQSARMARTGLDAIQALGDGGNDAELEVQIRLYYARAELEGGVRSEDIDHAKAGLEVLLQAETLLPRVPPQLQAEVYIALGRLTAYTRLTSDYNENRYFAAAREIYERLGDIPGQVNVLCPDYADTNPVNQEQANKQLANHQRALELARQMPDHPLLLAKALRTLAVDSVVFDTGQADQLEKGEEYARESIRLAAINASPVDELHGLLRLSWVQHGRGRYGSELEELRRSILSRARDLGQTKLEAEALMDLGHYYSQLLGGREQADQFLNEARDFRRHMGGHAVHESEALGFHLFRTGRLSEALPILRAAAERQDAARARRTHAFIGRTEAALGNLEAARQAAEESAASMSTNPLTAGEDSSQLMLCYAALGLHERAVELAVHLAGTVDGTRRRGALHAYGDHLSEIAETYRLGGDLGSASSWADAAGSYWSSLVQQTQVEELVAYWEHRFVESKLALDRQEYETAKQTLAAVDAAFHRFGHTSRHECQMLLGRASAGLGDFEGARAHLLAAEEGARQHELEPLAAVCRELIAALPPFRPT